MKKQWIAVVFNLHYWSDRRNDRTEVFLVRLAADGRVLAATIAITLEASHAVDVLQEAFRHHGTPGIVNTDPFSSLAKTLATFRDKRNISFLFHDKTAARLTLSP